MRLNTLCLLAAALLVSACGEKWGSGQAINGFTPGPVSVFDPFEQKMPFPNNFYMDPSTKQVKLPVTGDTSALQRSIIAQVNTLKGFSTLPRITFDFSKPLERASVNRQSVKLFEVTRGDKLVPVKLYNPHLNLSMPTRVEIDFDMPLKEDTTYLALVTNDVRGEGGTTVVGSQVFNVLKSQKPLVQGNTSMIVFMTDKQAAFLNKLWQVYSKYFDILQQEAGIKRASIVNMTAFTTQNITSKLSALYEHSTKASVALNGKGKDKTLKRHVDILSVAEFQQKHPELAYIDMNGLQGVIEGTMPLPDFRTPVTDDPASGGMGTTPKTVDVPFVLYIPAARQKFHGMVVQCDEPMKTAIFVHDIYSDEYSSANIAPYTSAACYALLAFDLPEHGTRPTRDVDGNGMTTSGEGFFDPLHLIATQANFLQAVTDMFYARRAIAGYSMDMFPLDHPNGTRDLDGTVPAIVGHGLTGALALEYARYAKDAKVLVLNTPAAYLARVMERSPTVGQRLRLLVAQKLKTEPSSRVFTDFFNWYLPMLQWVADPVDPLNYADPAKFKDQAAILYQEVVGDEFIGNGLNNNTPYEPNEVLAWALGIFPPGITASVRSLDRPVRTTVRFIKGYAAHDLIAGQRFTSGSVLERGFYEMTHEVWSFMVSGGMQVGILDSEVIVP